MVKYELDHPRTSNVNRMALIPYGFPGKNIWLVDEAKVGDKIKFKDKRIFTIVSKCLISTSSPIAESIAQAIYGRPIREIMMEMTERYKDTQDKMVCLLIYTEDNEE